MRKVWIEVALNGAWSRKLQPGIPDTVEAIVAEGIACARAGAGIVHTHAYTDGGRQTFDWQVYARIIEGIRAAVDVPVYPSYPTIPRGQAEGDPAARFAIKLFRTARVLARSRSRDRRANVFSTMSEPEARGPEEHDNRPGVVPRIAATA